MKNYNRVFIVMLIASSMSFIQCKGESTTEPQVDLAAKKAALGRQIFFDANLSTPGGQSCSSCHAPATGFSDPNHSLVSPGAISSLSTARNAPSIKYSMFTPVLHFDNVDSTYVGGFFLDGRVNTLEDQAKMPFLNHLEMNNADKTAVVAKVKLASYYNTFVEIYGNSTDVDKTYDNIADAIAAFERSPEVNPFTSKFDYYLKGEATFTAQEARGFELFKDTARAKCANCHITDADATSGKVLFTDFTYDNIGVPKNMKNPYYKNPSSDNPDGASFLDLGLGGFLKSHEDDGRFKVPSLRNAEVTGPYFHNGFFDKLEDVVHWYNVRDSATAAGGFPPEEITGNVNAEELGKLGLNKQEEDDIVAFIKTLTDGYK